MFFWKTMENPWVDTRTDRKTPPLFITLLLSFILFWAYMHAGYGLRELIFNGISAFLGILIENGVIENQEFAIYDNFNVIAYSFTFILLIPLSLLVSSFAENRKSSREEKHKKSVPGIVVLIIFIGLAIFSVISSFSLNEGSSMASSFSSSLIGIVSILLTVFLFLLYLSNGCAERNYLLKKENIVNRFFSGFLAGTVILAAVLSFLAIFNIFQIKGAGDFHWLSFLLGLICIGIMCFSEEYFFRGAVLSALGKKCHPLLAILLAAVLSSLCNYFYFNNVKEMNLLLIVNHILLGSLLGILVWRTGNLMSAIGARTALVLFSQLVFGIPFSNYSYLHSVFTSKYTTVSIWFTTDVIPGVDTGFAMFVMLALALGLALFLPVRNVHKENPDGKSYFRHVQPAADKSKAEPVADALQADCSAPVSTPSSTVRSHETEFIPDTLAQNMADTDNENWEEEETRELGTPNYQAPEDYLKK